MDNSFVSFVLDPGGGPTEAEPMSEKDLRDASSAIDVFGKPLVCSLEKSAFLISSHIYSCIS